MHRFEVYTDKAGEFRWRLLADNGQIIAASSEGYTARRSVERSIEIMREGDAKPEVYEDKVGEFRWRLKAVNGNIIATGGEGYTSRTNAEDGLQNALTLAHSAELVRLQDA